MTKYVKIYTLDKMLTEEDLQVFPEVIENMAERVIWLYHNDEISEKNSWHLLTYVQPDDIDLDMGDLVLCPYGNQQAIGVFLGEDHDKIKENIQYKEIIKKLK